MDRLNYDCVFSQHNDDSSTLVEPVPKIDFKKIEFPTDKVTVKDLRRLFPKLSYDSWSEDRNETERKLHGVWYRHTTIDRILDALMEYERDYAEQAFLKALGVPMSDLRTYVLQDVVDTVSSEYIQLGLATGEHQVAELVRGVERQAVAQANQYLGRRP